MTIRPYDPDRDGEACFRIWRETGWLDHDQRQLLDFSLAGSRAWVAEVQDEAECLVLTAPGTLRYRSDDLPFCGVIGVTTSRISRKLGLARQVLAQALIEAVAAGEIVAGLGIFEQGFYNTVGFGSLPYEHSVACDPAHLRVDTVPRVPRRLGSDDWGLLHEALLRRRRGHGAVNLTAPEHTRTEVAESKDGFGLGYADDPDGGLSHCFWVSETNGEHGPYRVQYLAFRTRDQLHELLALLKGLGDQVRLVKLNEPPGVQLQDFIDRPLRHWTATADSTYEGGIKAASHAQARILDLPACLAATRLTGVALEFALTLTDPLTRFLPAGAPWRGVGGDWVVTLGEPSAAQPGPGLGLPRLTCGVDAFTRLWLGVRPATGLACSDELAAPPSLLAALDEALRLPPPLRDWPF